MDRTVKQILDKYNRASLDQKNYIFSTALTGDLRKNAIRDLTKRFQKVQHDDPKSVPNGIRDLHIMDNKNVSNDTKQALHTIKQSGKGLGSTLGVDNLLVKHFNGNFTPGILTSTLAGNTLRLVHRHLKQHRYHQRQVQAKMQQNTKHKQQTEHSKSVAGAPSQNQNPENNMNQTNIRRKSEEHNEKEAEMARKRKLRRVRALKMRRAKNQMHF